MKIYIKYITLFIIFSVIFYYTDKTVTIMKENDPLLKEIKNVEDKYYEAPIDAYIDKVWHLIPGYNGVGVDVQASYDKMKENGEFDEKLIVLKEIKPNVTHFDLKKSPIFLGNERKEAVSIMVNVSWGEEYIGDMLDIFRDYNVKVTFFIDGQFAEKHPNYVLKIHLEGHELGNHGYNHHDVTRQNKDDISKELSKTNKILKDITLKKPVYFTPPSGAYNDNALEVVDSLDMKLVMFSVDTIDWQNPSVDLILNRVKNKLDTGRIILMHPTKNTVKALPLILETIEKRGLKVLPINVHLSENR